MELTHEFEVPVGIEDAFAVLTDIERVAPCMPGATLDEVDGDAYRGRVKVKVGPIQMTYRGSAEMVERDADAHRVRFEATGQESRGGGTARATVTGTMTALAPDRTAVTVHTDLALTGRPAQFGRGTIADVGDKLLGQFAECLATEVAGTTAETAEPAAGAPSDDDTAAAPAPSRESAPIDLIGTAGRSIAVRLAPVVALLVVAAAIVWWRARHG